MKPSWSNLRREFRPSRFLRVGWSVADQAVCSITNAALSFVAARSVSASAFGAFALAFTAYSLLVGLERVLVGQPLNMRTTRMPPEHFRREVSGALGSGFALGVASGGVLVVIGVLLGGDGQGAFVAMGVVLPALLLQDACRMALFAQRRPAAALANDLTWGAAQVVSMGYLVIRGSHHVAPYILAWGVAAFIAALVGLRQIPGSVSLRGAVGWLVAHHDLTRYLTWSIIAVLGAQQLSFMFVGVYGSLRDVGSLRGAQAVIAPWNVLASGAVAVALPALARRDDLTRQLRLRFALVVTIGLTAFGVVMVSFLFLVPAAGHALLGETWKGAHDVLFMIFLGSLGNTVAVAPACILDALGEVRSPFRGAVVMAPLMVLLSAIGVAWGGPNGAAAGLAIAAWAVVPYLWVRSFRAERVVPSTSRMATDVAVETPLV